MAEVLQGVGGQRAGRFLGRPVWGGVVIVPGTCSVGASESGSERQVGVGGRVRFPGGCDLTARLVAGPLLPGCGLVCLGLFLEEVGDLVGVSVHESTASGGDEGRADEDEVLEQVVLSAVILMPTDPSPILAVDMGA